MTNPAPTVYRVSWSFFSAVLLHFAAFSALDSYRCSLGIDCAGGKSAYRLRAARARARRVESNVIFVVLVLFSRVFFWRATMFWDLRRWVLFSSMSYVGQVGSGSPMTSCCGLDESKFGKERWTPDGHQVGKNRQTQWIRWMGSRQSMRLMAWGK